MIEEILPPGVRSAEAFDDLAPAPLFPEEAALMAERRPGRRRQFATARACARRSLGELGFASRPLLPAGGGAPQWPDGVVGSITHCDGYRAAVVARSVEVAALGIDAEPALPLPHGVLSLVSSPAERALLERLAAHGTGVCWDRLLFSAKEAVYKAWYPGARQWLGFRDVHVEIGLAGTFAALLHPADPVPVAYRRFTGQWLVRNGLLLTVVSRTAGTDPRRDVSSGAPGSATAY
ncbi:4'-phosphopantetheinyl transferase family protein [Streptomyces sp. H27-D2]|uniref:4'-phosphopantetheinyl transferase family protein n=1 Tax=Streptomyces sp. H27-D2 TaxID=3046304 RepID=UPI002DB559ED|nr:4'-phosphopantetheinyl transferase superfamily protein [Streptomyces sp. H27-D2]MEC4019682.1 4'-phosphopantetheinyl transferase superfamily protein [Streptomyces sp. H27-D2]